MRMGVHQRSHAYKAFQFSSMAQTVPGLHSIEPYRGVCLVFVSLLNARQQKICMHELT